MKFSNGGMLYPFPPILDSFHQKIFSSTLQRRLQRASVSKNKVFGFVQDDELFFQQVTDGDIGGKPDGFVHAMIINMAASAIGLELTGPVPGHRFTDGPYARGPFQGLHFTDEHQRAQITFVLLKTRRDISNKIAPLDRKRVDQGRMVSVSVKPG